MGRRQPFQYEMLGKLDSYMVEDTGLLSHTIYKINSKWIRCKARNHKPEENRGSVLSDISPNNMFLDLVISDKGGKRKNKWDWIKLKSLCAMKRNIKKVKRQSAERVKIFAKDIFGKEVISRIYNELL